MNEACPDADCDYILPLNVGINIDDAFLNTQQLWSNSRFWRLWCVLGTHKWGPRGMSSEAILGRGAGCVYLSVWFFEVMLDLVGSPGDKKLSFR